jgi:phosphinothricin acetyltransferase
MTTDFLVRASTDADIPAITAIYRSHVLHGTGSFEVEPPHEAELARRRADVVQRGLPWLVADIEGRVVGYAYAGLYRAREAYRFTLEDSVYIHPDQMGRGIGRALLEALIETCKAGGFRELIAVIGDSGNEGSIRVHAACGFKHVGVMKNVGLKFDRWLDVVIMQRSL